MRKLIKLAVVALGIRAFLHWRKSRRTTEEATTARRPSRLPTRPTTCVASSPSRARTTPPVEAAEPPAAAVADRRAEVHDSGRATLDEMNSSNED